MNQIVFEEGGLSGETISMLASPYGREIAILTDDTVKELYGYRLQRELVEAGCTPHLFSIAPGEVNKSREMKEFFEDCLVDAGCGRDVVIVALGGGVITDLAGFVAATYLRGVPFISCPTTLMAMVDAAIGGKTAINTKRGKNLIGAFYFPEWLIIDQALLSTLPKEEFSEGVVEMIKHGCIADVNYFSFLEEHLEPLLQNEKGIMKQAIRESLRIKTAIVEQDPKESGIRSYLNFGHTVGHALETASRYTLRHGRAVALGMIVESNKMERIEKLMQRLYSFADIQFDKSLFIQALQKDKKKRAGVIRSVQLNSLGEPIISELRINEVLDALCSTTQQVPR